MLDWLLLVFPDVALVDVPGFVDAVLVDDALAQLPAGGAPTRFRVKFTTRPPAQLSAKPVALSQPEPEAVNFMLLRSLPLPPKEAFISLSVAVAVKATGLFGEFSGSEMVPFTEPESSGGQITTTLPKYGSFHWPVKQAGGGFSSAAGVRAAAGRGGCDPGAKLGLSNAAGGAPSPGGFNAARGCCGR